jgi:transcriptional regulator with XRE-family HTH domain
MSQKSKGSVQLSSLVKPKKLFTSTEIAKRLGVSRQTVDAWCTGAAVPYVEHAAALEDLLGIPIRDWARDIDETQ